MKEKPVEMVALGKSGFVLAIGKVVQATSDETSEEEKSEPVV